MRTAIALLGILFCHPLPAVEAPKIVVGDYLLAYGQILECTSDLQAIEAAQVDENGVVTFFGNISLLAKHKPVYRVRNELVDAMERTTGHRSRTLEIHHVPGSDVELSAKRLIRFASELKSRCARMVLPPQDFDPNPNWANEFERIVHSSHNKSFKADAVGGTHGLRHPGLLVSPSARAFALHCLPYGFNSPLRTFGPFMASFLACTSDGYTRSLFSLREIRHLDSACPA